MIALKRVANTICILLFSLFAAGQDYYIKGDVRDKEGTPLQNITLLLRSTGGRNQAGRDGSFAILSATQTDTLTVIRDGFPPEVWPVTSAQFNFITLKQTAVVKMAPSKLASLTANLASDDAQHLVAGSETYTSTIENRFINTAAYPTTGLTVNIDKASYSNIRRFLNLKSLVPPDAVRIEEMLNYFNLGYTEPPAGDVFHIITTLTECPWNKANQLLFAQVTAKKLSMAGVPPSHLVFLIDVSGSMDLPNRLPLLKSSFKALVNNLRPVDSVSIVVYGGTVGVALMPTSGAEKERIFGVIDSLQPGGSTPGESGVKLAYSLARNHYIKGGNNRVILATDGDFNVGLKKEEELEDLISSQRAAGIYLTCLGVGMGNYKDSKIQTLAQRGNGNFAYLDSYNEAEKVLLKEFMQTMYTVADDAYLSVQFNPALVKEYRLIGFDNKTGAIKDVAANIEGGEVGPAYSSIIAFEIVPAVGTTKEAGQPAAFTLRYKSTGAATYTEMKSNPPVRFTPFAQLAPTHRFASAVIMFGSLLRGSAFIKNITWSQVLDIAKPAVEAGNYSQAEFLTLVEQARKLYGKKKKGE